MYIVPKITVKGVWSVGRVENSKKYPGLLYLYGLVSIDYRNIIMLYLLDKGLSYTEIMVMEAFSRRGGGWRYLRDCG